MIIIQDILVIMLQDTLMLILCIFLRGNSNSFCKSLQKVAVIPETAFLAGFHHGTAFCQEFFGMSNALCGNIAVDSGSGGIFENLAQVGTAEIKMLRKVFDRQVLCQVLINVGQDFIDLCMVGWRFGSRNGLFGTLSDKNAVQKCHHFQKYRMIQNILSVFFIIAKLVDIIMKAFLFFF